MHSQCFGCYARCHSTLGACAYSFYVAKFLRIQCTRNSRDVRTYTYIYVHIRVRVLDFARWQVQIEVFESSSLLQPLPLQETKEEAGTLRFRTS